MFVHGINVRGNDLERTVASILPSLVSKVPGAVLVTCPWGDEFGARLNAKGSSIPDYDAARALAVLPQQSDLALWELLYADPFFELRLLAARSGDTTAGFAPGDFAIQASLNAMLSKLAADPTVGDKLVESGLRKNWPDVMATFPHTAEVKVCIETAARHPELARGALARSLVANLVSLHIGQGSPCITGAVRDELAALFEEKLGGTPRGIVSWVSELLVGIAQNAATRYVKRNRGMLSDASGPIVGDVIRYQGRGQAIRARIAETIAAQSKGLIILAHSLGGVAVVDTLLSNPSLRKTVANLFTVGSQAGFFYENDALTALAYGEPLPDDFPVWTNVFDRNDALSFLTKPLLGTRSNDIELPSNQPFPQSHSAYWANPALYQLIASQVKL